MGNGNTPGGQPGDLPKVNLFKDAPTEAHAVPNQAPPVPPPVLAPPPATAAPAAAGQLTPGSGKRVPLIAIGVVVALVAAIALFAAMVSGSDKQDQESAEPATGGVEASDEEQATTTASPGTNTSTPTTTATTATAPPAPPSRQSPTSASASCVAPEGFEADRSTVRYEAGNVLDGLPDTAWRCPGSAVGETLRVTLAGPTEVTSIGLLPGYAKIDPTDGTNRFFQNRRVTAVRYHFDDGSTVDQSFADTPTTQTVSISAVTSSIVIEILSTTGDGGRDFTAISEIEVIGRPGTSCGSAGEAPGGGCCVDYVDAVGFPDAPPPGLCASE
jgi:hypothetical protein